MPIPPHGHIKYYNRIRTYTLPVAGTGSFLGRPRIPISSCNTIPISTSHVSCGIFFSNHSFGSSSFIICTYIKLMVGLHTYMNIFQFNSPKFRPSRIVSATSIVPSARIELAFSLYQSDILPLDDEGESEENKSIIMFNHLARYVIIITFFLLSIL